MLKKWTNEKFCDYNRLWGNPMWSFPDKQHYKIIKSRKCVAPIQGFVTQFMRTDDLECAIKKKKKKKRTKEVQEGKDAHWRVESSWMTMVEITPHQGDVRPQDGNDRKSFQAGQHDGFDFGGVSAKLY
ncbi:LOW QUALITY PROTEIN: hypothetical protein PoB_003942700 [Plakobranchus ocellatus]|uniref:Uncharacterized protein n=1 Tax=Plakobranchus ocellatus TaxID=259542 RepID=A0AAV4B089_9GAST|nr:LOW QUALITY PROTEIN: hypothetical protein PoB_003942700 [Plakobranchus ocellatus]